MHKTLEIWAQGCGVIKHSAETKKRISALLDYLKTQNIKGDGIAPEELLVAADRVTNAALWLVVHQTYARHIYTDGRPLAKEDFKLDPQGHLGGALNMVPAYVGYMLANALMGVTRGWVMEQGHAVAAIDSINLLLGNMLPAHKERYDITDKGLSAFAQDFYSYKLGKDGMPDSPIGSHVNPHTAGGHMEGGYLGFASVQYAHMPLKGERLVAFLSDGAFEEQRGADWTPRWWRAEDSGLVSPIMIANGRRIDQRSTLAQEGDVKWFAEYLSLHGFDPIAFDGRDPAAFAWVIIEQEKKLQQYAGELQSLEHYHVKIPYGIALAPKGAGFYNEGTNHAHNLPLVTNPSKDETAASRFNAHASKLYVPWDEVKKSISLFQHHKKSNRALERDNPIANRDVKLAKLPDILEKSVPKGQEFAKNWKLISPMDAIDDGFLAMVKTNPNLRPRVGNPDEMRSNRMDDTLEALEFRVVDVEEGIEESTLGKVITALNEEAVAGAAFGNKGGINIVVTYEAFGAKMFGEMRQEVIFSKHCKDLGRPAKWLSVPLIMTSNSWENSKNELSHQDPSLAESMFSETSDISRVLFPVDYNSAAALIHKVYQTQGEVWTVVVPKQTTPLLLSQSESEKLIEDGAIRLSWASHKPTEASLALIAVGAYQLIEVLKASERLRLANIPHVVSCIAEPGRFRHTRNKGEEAHLAASSVWKSIMPDSVKHLVFATHTRPEVMVGALYPLWQGRNIKALGFINNGGTLGVEDMLYVNSCSWAHILHHVNEMLGLKAEKLLSSEEQKALQGKVSPDGVITKLKG